MCLLKVVHYTYTEKNIPKSRGAGVHQLNVSLKVVPQFQ